MGVPDVSQAVTFKVATLFDNSGLFWHCQNIQVGYIFIHRMRHSASIAQFLASGIVCQGVSKTGQFGEGFFLWDEISQAYCLFCYY